MATLIINLGFVLRSPLRLPPINWQITSPQLVLDEFSSSYCLLLVDSCPSFLVDTYVAARLPHFFEFRCVRESPRWWLDLVGVEKIAKSPRCGDSRVRESLAGHLHNAFGDL